MDKAEYETEDVIFNVQRYSLHDGPSVQAIPFLKGCPLSCKWCSNLESQHHSPELLFKKNDCIRCGKCIDACPQQTPSTTNAWLINRDRCIQYGKYTEICPTCALEMKSKRVPVTVVMCELEKKENLYRRSDGGITLSGSESLAQPEFAHELLRTYKTKDWHAAIETSDFATKTIIDEVFPYVGPVLTGVKAIDPEIHERSTGMNNRVILENLPRISLLTKMVVCTSVVPGVDDDSQEIHNITEFARLIQSVDTIHLLPYHSSDENKYNLLGRQYPMGDAKGIEEA